MATWSTTAIFGSSSLYVFLPGFYRTPDNEVDRVDICGHVPTTRLRLRHLEYALPPYPAWASVRKADLFYSKTLCDMCMDLKASCLMCLSICEKADNTNFHFVSV